MTREQVRSTDGRQVLVIDDELQMRAMLTDNLAFEGYRVTAVDSGEAGLAEMERNSFALVLMDVMLPGISGFEVCQKLKADPATQRILVLMVTALNEPGDIERGVKAGTNDFLSKPVNKLELLKRVEIMLRLKDLTDENERLRRYIEDMEASEGPN